MPAKDKEVQESGEEKPTKRVIVTESVPESSVAVKSVPRTPWPLITIGVVATVVVMAVAVGGWLFIVGRANGNGTTTRTSRLGAYGFNQQSQGGNSNGNSYFGNGNGGFGGGGYRRGSAEQAAADGVITAVNGQTLTVSGQGKQVTVTETNSTVVSGDASSVAVNDTVLVYGTTNSDGSVTATRIVIRNNASASDTSVDGSSDTIVPGA